MDYHRSYNLMNYKLKDPDLGMKYENLEVVRGLNGCEHESGFILSHVAIAGISP